ncbi:MAG: DoxX family protein [Puia sp.]|nr:DoxX family protein [Puia sp.]
MKKFLSTNYSENAFNIATLLLRLVFGGLICIVHGLQKLSHFQSQEVIFPDPFHIGHRWSLVLVVFAEIFCAILLVLGLFTRLAALILVVELSIVVFLVHKGQPIAVHEMGIIYLGAFFSILLVGPGKMSVDGAMGK